jgi:hypothetical protein
VPLVRVAAVFALALGVARVGTAGDDEIVADRPGFGESASVVAARRVQAEAGATWTLGDSSTTVIDMPELLVRVGLGRSFELRATAPNWIRPGGTGAAPGWADAALGLKGHVTTGQGDLALRGTVYLPTGTDAQSAGHIEPEASVAWSRDLPAHWSLGATVSVRRLRLLRETLTSPSISLGRALGSRASVFVEYGAALARDDHAVHKLDSGYTRLVNPNTQLDASVGVGLSAAGPAFFAGVGFSRRF